MFLVLFIFHLFYFYSYYHIAWYKYRFVNVSDKLRCQESWSRCGMNGMIEKIGKAQIMIGVTLNRRGQESPQRVGGPPPTLFQWGTPVLSVARILPVPYLPVPHSRMTWVCQRQTASHYHLTALLLCKNKNINRNKTKQKEICWLANRILCCTEIIFQTKLGGRFQDGWSGVCGRFVAVTAFFWGGCSSAPHVPPQGIHGDCMRGTPAWSKVWMDPILDRLIKSSKTMDPKLDPIFVKIFSNGC